jgi:hypothetical protein
MADSEWTGFDSHVEVTLFHKCAYRKGVIQFPILLVEKILKLKG